MKIRWNSDISSNIDELRGCHTLWSKSNGDRQMEHDLTPIVFIENKGMNEWQEDEQTKNPFRL